MLEIKDFGFVLHRRGSEETFYEFSDEDNATSIQYYGWLNADGYWIIQKLNRSGNPITNRFISGKTDYATAWANRASLSYGYYSTLFT